MIEVKHLTFSYGKEPFIEDMNFDVKEGEIFGFLGPSGAGKSTLEKIIIGLIPGYQGSVTVGGIESNHHGKDFYENIGVDFEFSTMYEKMTAKENLRFFASLYRGKSRNIDELLRQMALLDSADKKVSAYSKGMKSRLNFIKALIHDPEVLLLDEPTSGLDPTNSRIMKEAILAEKERGKTVLLTTHNMMDAAELCDRVAFIVDGRICALDTPHNLIMKRGADKVTYTWNEGRFEQSGECLLSELSGDARLQELIARNKVTSIHSSEPSLNDIFMEVTGRRLV